MQMYLHVRHLLLVLFVLASSHAHAVTLGDARVKSFLNQPLDVEIDLVGLNAGQNEDLRLRIANQTHFDRLGIVYSAFLVDLNFDVVQSGGRWMVRARSRKQVTEPFLEFPLQMSWPGGQLIRQYTFLLDPQQTIRPARVARPSRAPTQAQPAPAAPVAPATQTGDVYGPVKRGETLWPIAKRLKPRGITTRQMAMALLRANPQAFIDNNVNKLRAGAVLTIPPRAFIEELDAQTARAQFAAQTQPRRQAAVATSPRTTPPTTPVRDSQAGQTTAASPQPEQTASPTEPADAQLRIISKKDQDVTKTDSEQALEDKLLVTMEEIESNRLTTDAIQTRLERLESEISRMQELVDLKNAQIAALQSEINTQNELEAAAQIAEPPPPVPAVTTDTVYERATPAAADTQAAATPAAVTIEAATPADTAREAVRPWHEQYLWLIWVALALLGLTALLLMFRRPQTAADEPMAAELPAVATAGVAAIEPRPVPPAADLREAEADFRAVSDANLPGSEDADAEGGVELPDLDISQIAAADDHRGDEEISDSVLAEMLEESRLVPEAPTGGEPNEADFDDDDIASWIRELGGDGDNSEPRSANDEQLAEENVQPADDNVPLPDNDEIPSILNELDDQLTGSASTEFSDAPNIQLEPVEDPGTQPLAEDDTFTMSLDLARAYLEIGDQEGARDMLKQALAGARDPDHRRQIEELLQQIG